MILVIALISLIPIIIATQPCTSLAAQLGCGGTYSCTGDCSTSCIFDCTCVGGGSCSLTGYPGSGYINDGCPCSSGSIPASSPTTPGGTIPTVNGVGTSSTSSTTATVSSSEVGAIVGALFFAALIASLVYYFHWVGKRVLMVDPSVKQQIQNNQMKWLVFISYSWEPSKTLAVELSRAIAALSDVPFDKIFLDQERSFSLSGLEREVETTAMCIVLISSQYLRSVNCLRELDTIRRENKPFEVVIRKEQGYDRAGYTSALKSIETNGDLPLSDAEKLTFMSWIEQVVLTKIAVPWDTSANSKHQKVELDSILAPIVKLKPKTVETLSSLMVRQYQG
jgi:hypothetical protein